MGAAVREPASNLQLSSDAMVEQRRQNAQHERRVLVDLPLASVLTDDLPRDRIDLESVAGSDEMEELKTSIRARGQREPIEVYAAGKGTYQLKKGWRRLTAPRQLFAETGDDRFAVVTARVAAGAADRLDLYIDMVCAGFAGGREGQAALRDAAHLTRADDDPGPAGAILRQWSRAVVRPVSVAHLDAASGARRVDSAAGMAKNTQPMAKTDAVEQAAGVDRGRTD
jgi:hypothetical protein